MASASRWKRHERDWAEWCGHEAKRQPSQGVPAADILNMDFTAEHKTTKRLPGYLAKAIDQAKENKERDPDKDAYVFVTYAPDQGVKARRFILREVDFDEDDWDEVKGKINDTK